jgi:hypothetical protein
MYTGTGVNQTFLDAIRGPHHAYGYLEAWRAGTRLTIDSGSALPVADDGSRMPLVDGTVQVDGSTPGVRRTLTARLAPMAGLWDLLAPIGTELRPYTVLRYPSGATVAVPQGVFVVDVQRIGYAANGDLQITAPDRWVRVQRARFLTPRQFGGVTNRALIATLLLEALPTGTVVTDLGTSAATVPKQTEDRDRAGFIQKLAKAASLDVFMDRAGNPVIRDVPQITNSPVWTVDAGATGVMIDADRERNRQRTYNLVVVNGTRNDGTIPFATQYVWDNNPLSPTYAGPGSGVSSTPPAASSAGPLGQVPLFYASPLLANVAQAQKAGLTLLGKVTGLAAQLTLTAVSNPALDDGDTINVQLPRERRDLPRPVERHITDTLTVPLVPHATPQQIATRSTVADLPDEAG